MKSKDEKIRKQAESWDGLIDKELTDKPHEIPVKPKDSSLNSTCSLITSAIVGLKPEVAPKLKSGSDTAIRDKVKSTVEGGSYTATVGTNVNNTIQSKINQQSYSVSVGITDTSSITASIKAALKQAMKVKAALKDKNGNLISEWIAQPYAQGGIVSGDLFLANENGVPEMVGRFGNQTAVANTDQIVDGISRGVAIANGEQNALLAQQNELLRSILQKDSSVRLQASAALGRVARQSLNMYSGMTGV
jgi:hypothetical protein